METWATARRNTRAQPYRDSDVEHSVPVSTGGPQKIYLDDSGAMTNSELVCGIENICKLRHDCLPNLSNSRVQIRNNIGRCESCTDLGLVYLRLMPVRCSTMFRRYKTRDRASSSWSSRRRREKCSSSGNAGRSTSRATRKSSAACEYNV